MKRLPTEKRQEYWANIIQEFHKSGLSKMDFCRHKDISTTSFYAWLKKNSTVEPSQSLENAFLPLSNHCRSQPSSKDIVMRLKLSTGGELSIEGLSTEAIKHIMQGLL